MLDPGKMTRAELREYLREFNSGPVRPLTDHHFRTVLERVEEFGLVGLQNTRHVPPIAERRRIFEELATQLWWYPEFKTSSTSG